MALKWPDKNPDVKEDFSVDWSRALRSGETISSVEWLIGLSSATNTVVESATPINGLQAEYPSGITNTDTVATIRLGLGTINTKYLLTCRITTSTTRVLSEDIYLRVTEGA